MVQTGVVSWGEECGAAGKFGGMWMQLRPGRAYIYDISDCFAPRIEVKRCNPQNPSKLVYFDNFVFLNRFCGMGLLTRTPNMMGMALMPRHLLLKRAPYSGSNGSKMTAAF
jgi:hypothetical protein